MSFIGIIGGTFDPIHNGHIIPALEVAEHFQFSKLLLLPLGVAVHRDQPQASAEQRLKMCQLSAYPHSIIEVDDREIRRGGESYSVITLEELRQEYGDKVSLCWLMGRDAIEQFTQWKDWQRILELANIAVMQRPGYELDKPLADELQPYYADRLESGVGNIVFQTVTPQAVSSTEIRQKLHNGENVQGLLPENVRKYALEQQIYTAE